MALIDVYSRPGCHLCEVLIERLLPLVDGRAEIVVHDVDSRDDWRERYGHRIPVVALDGEFVCQYRLDSKAILNALEVRG